MTCFFQLEIRLSDHREAIDDFTSLEIIVSKVNVHLANAPKGEGWIDLPTSGEGIVIGKHLGGPGTLVFRSKVAASDYNALRFGVAHGLGRLKNGKEIEVKFIGDPVFLPFTVISEKTTVVSIDLYMAGVNGHPNGGYDMGFKGATYRVLDPKL